MEIAENDVAQKNGHEDHSKAGEQIEVTKHHRISHPAYHTQTGLLRQRTYHQGDHQCCIEGGVLGAGATLREGKECGSCCHENKQNDHHAGEHQPFRFSHRIAALQRKALLQEKDADQNAQEEACQPHKGVQISSAHTDHHTQRAS